MPTGQVQAADGAKAGARDSAAWTGFLVVAFAAVGLVGAAGIYGAQVPYERALARDGALDQALLAAASQDAGPRLEALRPALDDSAAFIFPAGGDFAGRVAAERRRMFAAFATEAHNIRVRMLIGLSAFTAGGCLFGALVLSIVGRR